LLKSFSARPFVEAARIHAGTGDPPGLFDANLRYGTSWMWMYTMGVRLKAGTIHDRMGRYGAAVVPEPGTRSRSNESHDMPGMPGMPGMASPMAHHSANAACTL